jgi:hypothetical protein
MRLLLLIAAVLLFVRAPMNAGTISTVTCSAGAVNLTQSEPNNASCDAIYRTPPSEAAANATAVWGSLYGSTGVDSNECCAIATSDSSFDAFFANSTTLTWIISVNIDGPYAYASLDPLTEYNQEYSSGGTVEETLGPGEYTFSAYSYVSDEGGSSVSASTVMPDPVPEPTTLALAVPVLLLGLISARKAGR